MWATIISSAVSILLFGIKAIIQFKARKKLSDKELVEHIQAFQKNTAGVSNQASDFEIAIQEAYDKSNSKDLSKDN